MVVKFITKPYFLSLQYFSLFEKYCKLRKTINNNRLKACSSGDRASDSDSESQGFDSLHAYKFINKSKLILGLLWFRHLKLVNV